MFKKGEIPLTINFQNWLFFPFIATFNLVDGLNSGRTGFGLILMLLFPTTMLGLFGQKPINREFVIPLSIVFLFFTIWFFSGTTLRVRHLLPIFPLLLIICISISKSFFDRFGAIHLLSLCFIIVIGIQLAGQIVFGYNYAKFIFTGETKKLFLERNIPESKGVYWINENLPSKVRVAHTDRGIAYLFNHTSFMLHPYYQKIIDVRPSAISNARFVTQLKAEGITHLMISNLSKDITNKPVQSMFVTLLQIGCLETIWKSDILNATSRTLRSLGVTKNIAGKTQNLSEALILKINYKICQN